MSVRILICAIATIFAIFGAAEARAQHADFGSGPFGDHTFLAYDPTNGVQIEYMDAAGNAYLWYPGEAQIIRGTWRYDGAEICFFYPDYQFPPFPNEAAGTPSCFTYDGYFATTLDKRADDPFNLRSGVVPFVTRTGDYFWGLEQVEAERSRR